MPDFSSLNPLAILLATVVSGALGAAWYSPLLFANAWMSALGKTEEDLGSPGPAIAGSIGSCLVAAISVDILLAGLGVTSWLTGAGVGALLGFGIVAMTMLSDAVFSGWGWRLYVIQMSYRAIYLVLMGAICGAWR